MNLTNFALLSLLYFWGSSTALSLGVGYYTIYRPIIAGFLTGVILNQPLVGMAAGAVVNIIYIDFVSTGGSFKGDQCLTAMIAAIVSILLKLSPVEAAAAAYPFGYIGILIWKYRLNINSVFVKKYEDHYEQAKAGNKKFPEISIYDGYLPQLILFAMSVAVFAAAVLIVLLLRNYMLSIKSALYLIGLFLVWTSSWNIVYKLQNKNSMYIFTAALAAAIFLNPASYAASIAAAAVIWLFSNKNLVFGHKFKRTGASTIRKRDLVYSWFIWMNFSHSCYSFERLQGMAYAHSMKNIIKRIYRSPEEIAHAIHRHTEHFNTEPNMGTPIHGYIISLEEKQSDFDEKNIAFIKKGMMGIAAGLGDSYTQVVLTPLCISLSILLSMDNNFMFLIPVLVLALIILIISYTGFMQGYYVGKESLIERINIIKNSKIKKYFHLIFSGILGVSLGKLLLSSNLLENLTMHTIIGIIAVAYATFKNRSLK